MGGRGGGGDRRQTTLSSDPQRRRLALSPSIVYVLYSTCIIIMYIMQVGYSPPLDLCLSLSLSFDERVRGSTRASYIFQLLMPTIAQYSLFVLTRSFYNVFSFLAQFLERYCAICIKEQRILRILKCRTNVQNLFCKRQLTEVKLYIIFEVECLQIAVHTLSWRAPVVHQYSVPPVTYCGCRPPAIDTSRPHSSSPQRRRADETLRPGASPPLPTPTLSSICPYSDLSVQDATVPT